MKELRSHVKDLEEEIAQMVESTESSRKERLTQEQQSQLRRESLESKLRNANEEIVGLRSKLQLYRDYDEVKRELEILKVSSVGGGRLLLSSKRDTERHPVVHRIRGRGPYGCRWCPQHAVTES